MRCFAGIDIGSTNVKILVLNEDGAVVYTASSSTPKDFASGYKCFDIKALDSIIDCYISEAASGKYGKLCSVSFSSVGETVVPIDENGAIENPVFWDEFKARPSDEELRLIGEKMDFSIAGVSSNGLMMSLEKILWYKARFRERGIKAIHYLPLASYQIYRKTGHACWDYSLASRSHVYNVYKKEWHYSLISELGLESPGDICPMGSYAGSADGIVYGVGGHDHDMGLFGLYCIFDSVPFVFDSMGTSSTVSIITDDEDRIGNVFSRNSGGIINGFKDNQYIVFRGCSQYGAILSFWMRRFGLAPDDAGYSRINSMIPGDGKLAFIMRCGGNYLEPSILRRNEIDMHIMDLNADAGYFIKSGYLYCAMKTRDILQNLLQYASVAPSYYVGGAATGNELFMRYKASILGRTLHSIPIKEICAFGAVCSGAKAAGDEALFKTLAERTACRRIEPDEALSKDVSSAMESYKEYAF